MAWLWRAGLWISHLQSYHRGWNRYPLTSSPEPELWRCDTFQAKNLSKSPEQASWFLSSGEKRKYFHLPRQGFLALWVNGAVTKKRLDCGLPKEMGFLRTSWTGITSCSDSFFMAIIYLLFQKMYHSHQRLLLQPEWAVMSWHTQTHGDVYLSSECSPKPVLNYPECLNSSWGCLPPRPLLWASI